jgi:VWFA-related protein
MFHALAKFVYATPLVLAAALWVCGQETPTFRADVQLITVNVQVLSRNQPVLGLKQTDFQVWDEDEAQTITNFGAEDQPLDVYLLLDVSGSMAPVAERLKETSRKAMEQLTAHDRVGIGMFANRTYLVIPPTSDFEAVAKALEIVPHGLGGTELNSSVLYSSLYLRKQARRDARLAVVILTDNEGYSRIPDDTVRNGLWEADVVLNALLFPADSHRRKYADVRRFVTATGGEALKANSKDLRLDEMFQRLRERYVLIYHAPGGEPGSIRRIKVDLTKQAKSKVRDLKIRTRTGYRVGIAGSDGRQVMQPSH